MPMELEPAVTAPVEDQHCELRGPGPGSLGGAG